MPTRFTIAIPTHDRRETVVLAARSALAQTRAPEQLLVLCDGCTDGTAEAVRALGDPRIEALELEKGPGYGYEHRNRALDLARGDAILWLADDDLLLPDHLERLGELWDSGPFDVVQSHAVLIHPDDTLEWMGADWSVPYHRAALERENSNPMASVSIRVELARTIGGWDARVERAADWDLWRRAMAAGARSATSPEPTHLHFRASLREQAWPDRVRQNTAWLATVEDPARLRELRVVLRRVRAEHEADVAEHVAGLERHGAEATRYAESLRAALDAAERDLAAARADAAALDARRHAAETEALRLAATLQRIYAGGWWRLRNRLQPLMRLARRGG